MKSCKRGRMQRYRTYSVIADEERAESIPRRIDSKTNRLGLVGQGMGQHSCVRVYSIWHTSVLWLPVARGV